MMFSRPCLATTPGQCRTYRHDPYNAGAIRGYRMERMRCVPFTHMTPELCRRAAMPARQCDRCTVVLGSTPFATTDDQVVFMMNVAFDVRPFAVRRTSHDQTKRRDPTKKGVTGLIFVDVTASDFAFLMQNDAVTNYEDKCATDYNIDGSKKDRPWAHHRVYLSPEGVHVAYDGTSGRDQLRAYATMRKDAADAMSQGKGVPKTPISVELPKEKTRHYRRL